MTDSPVILDVEASGFGPGSYPVEVGYVLQDGSMRCMLIRPAAHWTAEAERLHRIPREELLRHGAPVDEVVEQLNRDLCGRTVYTDSWAHDYSWLAALYEAAHRVPSFRLENIHVLLAEPELERWSTVKQQVAAELALPRHRACADARVLQATLGRLRTMSPPAGPCAPAVPTGTARPAHRTDSRTASRPG
jgi:hypothetical protein